MPCDPAKDGNHPALSRIGFGPPSSLPLNLYPQMVAWLLEETLPPLWICCTSLFSFFNKKKMISHENHACLGASFPDSLRCLQQKKHPINPRQPTKKLQNCCQQTPHVAKEKEPSDEKERTLREGKQSCLKNVQRVCSRGELCPYARFVCRRNDPKPEGSLQVCQANDTTFKPWLPRKRLTVLDKALSR